MFSTHGQLSLYHMSFWCPFLPTIQWHIPRKNWCPIKKSDHIRPTNFRYLSTKQPPLTDGTETICIDSFGLFVYSWAIPLAQVSNLREKNLNVHSMSRNYHHNFVWPNCTSSTYTTETSQQTHACFASSSCQESKYLSPNPWDDAICHKSWWFTPPTKVWPPSRTPKFQEARKNVLLQFKSSQSNVVVVMFGLGCLALV